MTLRIRKNFAHSTEPTPALYVCSTPIGNLGDVSDRLVQTLRRCDVVAAEDTRQTRKLLTRFEIHPHTLISCHEHNQVSRTEQFVAWWAEGKTIALVSDAGTPLVSDPGWTIVDAAMEHDVPVIPVPGPSALLAALVGSHVPAQPFAFFGFLPREKKEADRHLQAMVSFPGTTILYEAPHRLLQTLRRMNDVAADRTMTLAKELTKTHETFVDGTVREILAYVEEEGPRGEYVLVLGPPQPLGDTADATESALDEAVKRVLQRVQEGMSHTEASRAVAEEMGVKRRDLYTRTLGLLHGTTE